MEELLPQIRRTGDRLLEGLHELQQRHPVVAEVRGKGLMLGLQLRCPGARFVERARGLGLLINCTHETVVRLLPPFTLSCDEADQIVRTLDEVFVQTS